MTIEEILHQEMAAAGIALKAASFRIIKQDFMQLLIDLEVREQETIEQAAKEYVRAIL